jgi:hypothetical protein
MALFKHSNNPEEGYYYPYVTDKNTERQGL